MADIFIFCGILLPIIRYVFISLWHSFEGLRSIPSRFAKYWTLIKAVPQVFLFLSIEHFADSIYLVSWGNLWYGLLVFLYWTFYYLKVVIFCSMAIVEKLAMKSWACRRDRCSVGSLGITREIVRSDHNSISRCLSAIRMSFCVVLWSLVQYGATLTHQRSRNSRNSERGESASKKAKAVL